MTREFPHLYLTFSSILPHIHNSHYLHIYKHARMDPLMVEVKISQRYRAMKKMNSRSWVRGSCIGRGAYGTVNLGYNTTTGAVLAVKSVDLASATPSQVEALENEIRILKSLSSPFIVKYLGDDKTAEGSPMTSFRNLHMEYLPSGTAADLATTSMNLDEAAVASYTWCLASALSYLHSRGITHCDVKGRNVLLGASPGSAKLADFGSAAEITSAAAISARGSPLWMAPEVIRGEYQGPESDVWSLGCTVIEMLTGKPPWGADAYSVYRIGYSDEVPLFPSRLSRLALDFLDNCFRRDHTQRWSCDQLLQHPFISMSSQQNLITESSPRCVLDSFNSDFDENDYCEEEDDEELRILNLEANERIRGLAEGAGDGANWESSEGWSVVRGVAEDREGTWSEYFDSVGASSEYSGPIRRESGHIYSSSVITPRCLQRERFPECSNILYLSHLYKTFLRFIFLRLSRFVNFILFITRDLFWIHVVEFEFPLACRCREKFEIG
ncbi:MEKK [Handroanthus impetiginosus]|uniref:MEKK n=1 Tax=Handroanthus impetiginosus TaxID=429701 RepID=A0A2G9GHP1_9LAMI|nr:MEKK [Handroanthus impetiginosus]